MKSTEILRGGVLNRNRKLIFGFAALFILLGHSQSFLGVLPDAITHLIGYGGIGVTMFAFLSGVGLKQSLDRDKDLKRFYWKRIRRVVVPYLIIGAVMYIERDLIYIQNLRLFFADLFCISYWTDGRGAWYVAWMIPVYLLYPMYYNIVSRAKNHRWLISASVLGIITAACVFLEINQDTALTRFASPIGATIAFIIGDGFADMVKNNRKNTILILCIGILVAPLYLLDILCGGTVYVWFFALCGIALCALCGILVEVVPDIFVNRFVGNCGEVSLEIYLFNLFYIGFGNQLFMNTKNDISGILVYLFIMVLTIVSAFLFVRIRDKLFAS